MIFLYIQAYFHFCKCQTKISVFIYKYSQYRSFMHLSSRKFILPYPFLLKKIMGFSFLLNASLNHRVRRNNKLVYTSHHYSYTSLPRLQPQPEKK